MRLRLSKRERGSIKSTLLSLTFSLIIALGIEKLITWIFESYFKIQEPSAAISMIVIGIVGMLLYFMVF